MAKRVVASYCTTFLKPEMLHIYRQVHFVGDDMPGPLGKARIVKVDLAPQILEVFDRMTSFASGDIEHEKQQPAAGDMAEKIVAEPDVAMRSFDESRNVRDRRPAVAVEFDHAHNGMKGGERIRRHLRMRRGNFPQQSGFARVGITDERRVRHRAQLEEKVALLSFLAFRVLNGRAVLRTLEVDIALAAFAALAEDELFSVVGEIGERGKG